MKKAQAKAKTKNQQPSSATAEAADVETDAVALLKSDHRSVEKLFAEFESAGEDAARKGELANQICQALIVHAKIEEEIFYAACREKAVETKLLDEAQVEHDGAKVMIADIIAGSPGDKFFDAKVKVLAEYIKHHVGEEEKPRSGIFAKAKKAGLELSDIGARLKARKTKLMGEAEALLREPLEAISLQLTDIHSLAQESNMPRNSNQQDRDENGRFTSDDDNRSSRSGGNRGSSARSSGRDYDDNRGSRSSSERDRDDQGRFMSDDDDDDGRFGSRGRSQSSRSGRDFDDDRGGNYGGRGGRDRDEQGRFTSDDDDSDRYSSRGRSSARSRDDEDDYSSSRGGSDRDGRGRFSGGYDDEDEDDRSYRGRQSTSSGNRWQSGRGEQERDDQGRFTSDDDRGYSGQSRGRNDSDRQSRGGQSNDRSRSGRDSGDGRSSRSGGREQQSSSRNASRSSSSQEGSGHGGWFGDHRAHAEAARKGWQHRD